MNDKSMPLTLQAYTILKKKIMDLHLRPGELLLVQTLAKELGISRTPVREAVVRLEREGFVEAAEGKKFRVSLLTLKGVLEIHELRKLLEIHAARNVALASTEEQVCQLKETVDSMRQALSRNDHDDFFEADLKFHEQIILFNGNETLHQLMNQLNDKIQRIRYLTTYIDNRLEETVGEHQDIIAAIEGHDPDQTEKKINHHLEKVKTGLEVLFNEEGTQFMGGLFLR